MSKTNTSRTDRPAKQKIQCKTGGSAFTRFLRDQAWVVITWALCTAVLSGSFVLYGGLPGDAFYCATLSAIALIGGLAWRFHATLPLYALEDASHALAASPDKARKAVFDAALCRVEKAPSLQRTFQVALASKTFYETVLQREHSKNVERESTVLKWVHHAKTPLSVISLAAGKYPENDDCRLILKSASDLKRSLDQLLHMARVDDAASDLRIERVALAKSLESCVKRLKGYFIENKTFASFEGDADVFAYTDPKLLDGILDQLVSNAVKYSSEEGTVRLSCGIIDGAPFVSVRDEGCGIAPEDLPRIFDLFFTGKNGRRMQESSGIGLYLAKKAADALGATLQAESEEGRSTAFTLTFSAHPGI